MKWFLALNQACPTFPEYAKMLKVAVYTAQKHAELETIVLYDGAECELTAWLRRRRISVISHRTWIYDALAEIAQQLGDPIRFAVAAGAFLRTDIPQLTKELQIEDKVVLYTDIDVMFLNDVMPTLRSTPCRYIATAPEEDPNDYQMFNTGVMLMNLPRLRAEERNFRHFILKHLAMFMANTYDQSAYQMYYAPQPPGKSKDTTRSALASMLWRQRLGRLLAKISRQPSLRYADRLPLSLNWKPYWGDFLQAQIIHFHGLKPFQRSQLHQAHIPDLLRKFATPEYHQLCTYWQNALEELQSERLPPFSSSACVCTA
jgi:hypothetical protein